MGTSRNPQGAVSRSRMRPALGCTRRVGTAQSCLARGWGHIAALCLAVTLTLYGSLAENLASPTLVNIGVLDACSSGTTRPNNLTAELAGLAAAWGGVGGLRIQHVPVTTTLGDYLRLQDCAPITAYVCYGVVDQWLLDLFRLNGDILFVLEPEDVIHREPRPPQGLPRNIIPLPRTAPRGGTIKRILARRTWSDVSIYYDELMERHLESVVAAVSQQGAILRLYRMSPESSLPASLTSRSQNESSSPAVPEHVILLSAANRGRLFTALREQVTDSAFYFSSTFLVVCDGEPCVAEGEELLAQFQFEAFSVLSLAEPVARDFNVTANMLFQIVVNSSRGIDPSLHLTENCTHPHGMTFRKALLSMPFVMSRPDGHAGPQFYGMAIDLLDQLATMLNFTYTVARPPDGQFGAEAGGGNWTGMVGQLQRREADMIVAALSVTEGRDSVIDYIEYFFEYGCVLIRKPDQNENKWRVIMQPFDWPVWLCIIGAVPLAGVAAWGLALLGAHLLPPAAREREFLHHHKSIWYVFGAVITQGAVYLPRSFSERNFICSWWAFSVVLVATYGGSLIAYLTIAKTDVPFSSLDGLVGQTRYRWGTRLGNIYYNEFKNAKSGVRKAMWEGMDRFSASDPDVFEKNSTRQISKVMAGNYAYISDRTPMTIAALTDSTCNLVVMEDLFLPMPIGLGVQEGAPYRTIINQRVQQLRQSGLVQFWVQKWWPKPACSGIMLPESHAISLVDAQSAFYLLVVGVVLAVATLTAEVCRQRAVSARPPRTPTKVLNGGQSYLSRQTSGVGAGLTEVNCVAGGRREIRGKDYVGEVGRVVGGAGEGAAWEGQPPSVRQLSDVDYFAVFYGMQNSNSTKL